MRCFKVNSIAIAHSMLIDHVYRSGHIEATEDSECTFEAESVTVKVANPLDDMIHPNSSFQRLRCEEYARQVIQGHVAEPGMEFDYTYHERLFFENQLEQVISRITHFTATRRAVLYTWIPAIDNGEKVKPPCLQMVQIAVRDGRCNMHVVMRSNDVLSAFGPNAFAFVKLQQFISNLLQLPVGYYEHTVIIPHFYYKRDQADLYRWGYRGSF